MILSFFVGRRGVRLVETRLNVCQEFVAKNPERLSIRELAKLTKLTLRAFERTDRTIISHKQYLVLFWSLISPRITNLVYINILLSSIYLYHFSSLTFWSIIIIHIFKQY